MSCTKTILAAFAMCLIAAVASAQTTAPTTKPAGPLVVAVTSDATTVHPGDSIKFDVAIKNVSQEAQQIEVPNIVWAAGTDVPQITIPGWPARGGIGPVVIFKSVTIAPGESYAHTWTANVSITAEIGDVAFRVGVPLHRGGDKTWSDQLSIKIVAAPPKVPVENPLYDAWKGQETKSVSYTRQETISGGAPVPGANQRPPSSNTLSETCTRITDAQAEIAVSVGHAAAQTLVIPATLMPDDPALPKNAGAEDVKIGDKTYACTKYTYDTGSAVEMGRDGQGLRGRATVWLADGIPGGIVKRQIDLTIRASYEITDTLVP